MQHTFLDISLPLFCTVTTWNFQKRFYGGNVVRVLVHFFLLALNFSLHLWPLAFLILSPPLQNFAIPFELPYLLIELFDIGMPVVRRDGRAYCHVITKFSRMGRFFFPMGVRSSLRARSSAKEQELPKKWYIGQQGYLPLSVSMDVFKWKCQNRFVAYKTLNCKTVRVFAYSSTRE